MTNRFPLPDIPQPHLPSNAAIVRTLEQLGDLAEVYLPARSAAATVALPEGAQTLRTGGYSSEGDGGGASFRRVASDPGHPGAMQTADGAWWEIDSAEIHPEQFGYADSADLATKTAAVGDAAAVAAALKRALRFGPGTYHCDMSATGIILDDVRVAGRGRGITTLVADVQEDSGYCVFTANSGRCVIEDITFKYSGPSADADVDDCLLKMNPCDLILQNIGIVSDSLPETANYRRKSVDPDLSAAGNYTLEVKDCYIRGVDADINTPLSGKFDLLMYRNRFDFSAVTIRAATKDVTVSITDNHFIETPGLRPPGISKGSLVDVRTLFTPGAVRQCNISSNKFSNVKATNTISSTNEVELLIIENNNIRIPDTLDVDDSGIYIFTKFNEADSLKGAVISDNVIESALSGQGRGIVAESFDQYEFVASGVSIKGNVVRNCNMGFVLGSIGGKAINITENMAEGCTNGFILYECRDAKIKSNTSCNALAGVVFRGGACVFDHHFSGNTLNAIKMSGDEDTGLLVMVDPSWTVPATNLDAGGSVEERLFHTGYEIESMDGELLIQASSLDSNQRAIRKSAVGWDGNNYSTTSQLSVEPGDLAITDLHESAYVVARVTNGNATESISSVSVNVTLRGTMVTS